MDSYVFGMNEPRHKRNHLVGGGAKGCACRIAPLFSAARYMMTPLFLKKVYEWPFFLMLVYELPKFSYNHVYAHIFRMKKYINSKDSIRIKSTFCEIKSMNGLFFQRPGIRFGSVSK